MKSAFSLGRLPVLLVVSLGLGLSACGVRGGLEAPPEDKAESARAKAAKKAGATPEPPPHKPFVLDGLIR